MFAEEHHGWTTAAQMHSAAARWEDTFASWEHDEADKVSTPTEKTYLARMAGREGEALLIDPGSPGNLVGDAWSERMSALCATAGEPQPQRKDISAFRVGGFWSRPPDVYEGGSTPACLATGRASHL